MKWWGRQPPERQALVKQLVKDGQLNFINGGYVQHDEAGAHYSAMVDQTSLGHRWGARVGWGWGAGWGGVG